MAINDISNDFKAGDVIPVKAGKKSVASSYGTTSTFYPLSIVDLSKISEKVSLGRKDDVEKRVSYYIKNDDNITTEGIKTSLERLKLKELGKENEVLENKRQVIKTLEKYKETIAGVNSESDITSKNLADIKNIMKPHKEKSLEEINALLELEDYFEKKEALDLKEKEGRSFYPDSEDYQKVIDDITETKIEGLKRNMGTQQTRQEKKDKIIESLGGGKWNGSVYGKSNKYNIYINSKNKKISNELAKILSDGMKKSIQELWE